MKTRWLALGSVGFILACGAAPPIPAAERPAAAPALPAPAASTPVAASEPEAPPPASFPTSCASEHDGLCLPEPQWVERLCSAQRRSAALYMFRKGTPWTRGYLTRKTKAWNASGGASSEGELEFDEEVLVLRHRAEPKGGMQVSGMGGYDALRWDGGCVSLATEELTLKPPPAAKTPHVHFRLLDDAQREALRADATVDAAVKKQRSECKGATMGAVTDKCEKADQALSRAIIAYVRAGGELPPPQELP